jgi:hypothetical protein
MKTLLTEKVTDVQPNDSKVKAKDSKIADPLPLEQIALKAYQIWKDCGCTHGHDIEDWLKAEKELRNKIMVQLKEI